MNEILGELWEDDAFRTQLNRMLARVARTNGGLATSRKLVQDVVDSDQATVMDTVALLDVVAASDPAEAARMARNELQSAGSDPVRVLPVAAWMLRQGSLAREVSDWVDSLPKAAADDPALRLTWADAMAQQQRWQDMFDHMDKAEWGAADYARLACLSRALSELGNHILAGARWRQAVRAAASSPQFLWSLWAVSSQWDGWEEHGMDLMWTLYEATRSPAVLARLSAAYAEKRSAADHLRVARIA